MRIVGLGLVSFPDEVEIHLGTESTSDTGERLISYSFHDIYPCFLYRLTRRPVAEVLGVPQDISNRAIFPYDERLYRLLKNNPVRLLHRGSIYEVAESRIGISEHYIEVDLRELSGG